MTACNSKEEYSLGELKTNQIDRIHGLGYINGGNEFVIPTHQGYKHGEDGWTEAVIEVLCSYTLKTINPSLHSRMETIYILNVIQAFYNEFYILSI